MMLSRQEYLQTTHGRARPKKASPFYSQTLIKIKHSLKIFSILRIRMLKMKVLLLHKGFNFSQDGPGNRLVYHLQGCNFRCPWCSNPESMAAGGTVMTVQKSFNDTTKVKKLSCTEVEADELIIESVRSSPLFFDGGGVTLTGGEPTVQFSAVRYLLEGFKQNKIHTAMETNAAMMDCQSFSV
jgi:pyruvate-formate lyase-activating enzyme